MTKSREFRLDESRCLLEGGGGICPDGGTRGKVEVVTAMGMSHLGSMNIHTKFHSKTATVDIVVVKISCVEWTKPNQIKQLVY